MSVLRILSRRPPDVLRPGIVPGRMAVFHLVRLTARFATASTDLIVAQHDIGHPLE
ncbi:MAG: hypothetical protein QM699_10805 [Amaricoccus sp.]|uniref:hypothetical protein n=1 Tax=Amaricoccus sp. TaxID=1872485 RepID=UPI0039E6E7D4